MLNFNFTNLATFVTLRHPVTDLSNTIVRIELPPLVTSRVNMDNIDDEYSHYTSNLQYSILSQK